MVPDVLGRRVGRVRETEDDETGTRDTSSV